MAVMKLSPEQERHATVEPALVSNVPRENEFKAVRHITPLVMSVLMAVNNPFALPQHFATIGIEFDKKGRPLCSGPEFAARMMPKTAEVIILVTCTDDELYDVYGPNPIKVTRAAMAMVDKASFEQMARATDFVSGMIESMGKARAVVSDSDEKPSAKSIAQRDIKKKQRRTG